MGAGDDYLGLSDRELFDQCRFERFRASGPGGQHRNKTDSGVRLTHQPTGIAAEATERRSQHQNRAAALSRLRRAIAAGQRRAVVLEGYQPPRRLQRILPRSVAAEVNRRERIGPRHADFWLGAQALLDLLDAVEGSLAEAASHVGCSTNQLGKLATSAPQLHRAANAIRERHGLSPLRAPH